MAFCINCGKSLPKEAKFCPECGTSIKNYDNSQTNKIYEGVMYKCPQC